MANGHFPKDLFHYEVEAVAYHRPGSRTLDIRYRAVTRGHANIQHATPAACAACTIKARCTGSRWRRINRWENEAVPDRRAKRLAARPGIPNARRETVEHPFGSIKQ